MIVNEIQHSGKKHHNKQPMTINEIQHREKKTPQQLANDS